MIVVGVDAHSQTHTAAAVKAQTAVELDVLTVFARPAGRYLLGAGERVLRVPPKLMAEVRKSARTAGKSDPIDAVAVARGAIREPGLPVAQLPGPERELRLLVDHRDHLVQESTRHQRRLRVHVHELDPELQPPLRTLGQRKTLDALDRKLAKRIQDAQVRIARELIRRIRELTRRIKELRTQLHRLVRDLCPALLELPGCGPLTGARILAEIANIDRFATDGHLSKYCGTSPLDASSGKQRRHRLNRTGNRRLNRALYIIAVTQARIHPPARAYISRRLSEGKSSREAIRALKRFITRRVYRILTTAMLKPQRPRPITGTAPLRCV